MDWFNNISASLTAAVNEVESRLDAALDAPATTSTTTAATTTSVPQSKQSPANDAAVDPFAFLGAVDVSSITSSLQKGLADSVTQATSAISTSTIPILNSINSPSPVSATAPRVNSTNEPDSASAVSLGAKHPSPGGENTPVKTLETLLPSPRIPSVSRARDPEKSRKETLMDNTTPQQNPSRSDSPSRKQKVKDLTPVKQNVDVNAESVGTAVSTNQEKIGVAKREVDILAIDIANEQPQPVAEKHNHHIEDKETPKKPPRNTSPNRVTLSDPKTQISPITPAAPHTSEPTATEVTASSTTAEPIHFDNPASSPDIPISPQTLSPKDSAQEDRKLTDNQRLSSIVSQREQQLMAANRMNAELADEVSDLKAQVEKLLKSTDSGGGGGGTADENTIAEFSKRLEAAEKANSAALKDRDKYKAALATLQTQHTDLTNQLAIQQTKTQTLLLEGEKLSKNELKMSNIVKKLRAKEQESELALKEYVKKLEAATLEISDLKEKLSRISESERRTGDLHKATLEAGERQAKLIGKLENELVSVKSELSQAKTQYEHTKMELMDLKKAQEDSNAAAHAEALEKEIEANAALHKQLLEQQKQYQSIESSLQKEVYNLRSTLQRVEDESNWKEDNLRKEINSLQARLQAADARHDDLYAQAQSAERPLAREIEMLQMMHAAAQRNWEENNKSLADRLKASESKHMHLQQSHESAAERAQELSQRLTTLEHQLARERQDRSRIQAEYEECKNGSDEKEREVSDLRARLEVLVEKSAREIDAVKLKYESILQTSLEETKRKFEIQLKDERDRFTKERLKYESEHTTATSLASPVPRQPSSTSSTYDYQMISPTGYKNIDISGASGVVGVGNQGAVAEKLYRSLKHVQEQVGSLQTQLQLVTKTRDELAVELVKATADNSEGKSAMATVQALRQEIGELTQRYNGALELLGEKTEQVDDLKQSIAEMKMIQKAEIEEIMKLNKHAM